MRNEKPSVRQVEYFIAVAESDSFRRAAERLGVSQPTVTAQIAVLEKTLGIKLFERTSVGARLSPDGRQLIANARRVLEEVDGFIEAADEICNRPGGTFRLGVTPTLGPYVLPHLLPDLHREYPNLRFYVREGSPSALEAGLRKGSYDLGLSPRPLDAHDFAVLPLFREPVRLVIANDHELARRDPLHAADLKDADILTIEEHHRFFSQVEQLCLRLDARMRRDYQGTSLDALRHMVVMGMGHAFLLALYVLSEIHEQSQLHVTDIADEPIFRMHALAWRNASPARGFFRNLVDDMRAILRARLGHVIMVAD